MVEQSTDSGFVSNMYWRLSLPAAFDVAFTLVTIESLASAVKIKYNHSREVPYKHVTSLIEVVYMKKMTSTEGKRV
jgi:hypothetical protein